MIQYKDTIVSATEHRLVIFNERIERTYAWRNNAFVPDVTTFIPRGISMTTPPEAAMPDLGAPLSKTLTEYLEDNGGLSEPHAAVKVTLVYAAMTLETTYEIYPAQPFVTTSWRVKGNVKKLPRPFVIDLIATNRPDMTLVSTELIDVTDKNYTLARSSQMTLLPGQNAVATGHLFVAKDNAHATALFLAKNAPTHLNALCADKTDLVVHGNRYLECVSDTQLDDAFDGWQELYGATVGIGTPDELLRDYRRQFKMTSALTAKPSFTMANTWGDRSRDARVSEAFLLKELDAAHELGLDIVQIDDGWQTGITVNSAVRQNGLWSGYYDGNTDFWKVNEQKFPHGLQVVCDKAREYGIAIGLWFSPDSSHDFQNWQRDVETILTLHRTYGIRYFKLDGINIQSKRGENNFLTFLAAIHRESGNAITANMDITAQSRLAYLFKQQFGTLFVENRYTDHRSYYPHDTLKNVWTLAQFFPLNRFQFELLNNARNTDKYPDDALAPATYSIDYEFAAVMLANPLFWMEVSNLSPKQMDTLKPILAQYKLLRDSFRQADVSPIGAMPDGHAFTGFHVATADSAFVLLFRECTPEDTATLQLPHGVQPNAPITILAANADDCALALTDDTHLSFTAPRKQTYALAKIG